MNKAVGLVLMILVLECVSGCKPRTGESAVTAVPVDVATAASESVLGRDVVAWQTAFPLQTASAKRNELMQASPTGYGGSEPRQRAEWSPELPSNFSGIAFSKDYREDRGHVYAWEDLLETERTTDASPGACITCKTSDVETVFAQYGWSYANMQLGQLKEQAHAGIDCFACHDPDSKQLRVMQPGFIEALSGQGIDASSLTAKQLENYLCAQCHSEYYFEPGTKKVIHPWSNGLDPEDMFAYYQTQPAGFKADYTHTVSGTQLLKAQHPDFEEFQSGVHASAGVGCTDCHMPRISVDAADGTKSTITQHWITSPLHTVEASCMSCHKGKPADWLVERVRYIQDSAFAAMSRSGSALQSAHEVVALAKSAGVSETQLEPVRAVLREAQWYWDFSASANSTGFHNSDLTHDNMSRAMDLAYKAIRMAGQLAGRGL